MNNVETSGRWHLALAGGLAGFAAVAMVTVITLAPKEAVATPAYAAQTKLACGKCHVNPAGGGPNTAFGTKFEKNGHKLK